MLVTSRSSRNRRTLSALGHRYFFRMTGALVLSAPWNARRNDPSAKGLRSIVFIAGVRTLLSGSVIRSTPVSPGALAVDLDEEPAQRHVPQETRAVRPSAEKEARSASATTGSCSGQNASGPSTRVWMLPTLRRSRTTCRQTPPSS